MSKSIRHVVDFLDADETDLHTIGRYNSEFPICGFNFFFVVV